MPLLRARLGRLTRSEQLRIPVREHRRIIEAPGAMQSRQNGQIARTHAVARETLQPIERTRLIVDPAGLYREFQAL